MTELSKQVHHRWNIHLTYYLIFLDCNFFIMTSDTITFNKSCLTSCIQAVSLTVSVVFLQSLPIKAAHTFTILSTSYLPEHHYSCTQKCKCWAILPWSPFKYTTPLHHIKQLFACKDSCSLTSLCIASCFIKPAFPDFILLMISHLLPYLAHMSFCLPPWFCLRNSTDNLQIYYCILVSKKAHTWSSLAPAGSISS